MYNEGRGVPQDHKEAEKWFRLAANQGVAVAQALLGLMYEDGQGVPQDNVMAYALYNLASSSTQQAATNRQSLVTQMTRAQIENGQELTRQMLRPGNFTKAYQARLETIARPQR
jgi:TPR repeat protein